MFVSSNRLFLFVSAFLFFAFLLLGISVKFSETIAVNEPIILGEIHQLFPEYQGQFWVFITQTGNSKNLYFFTGIIAIILWILRRKREAIYLIVSVVGNQNLNVLVKNIWQRPRPELWEFAFYSKPQDFSFPSGHAMGSINLALTLLIACWGITKGRWKILLAILATIYVVLVSFSRLYLGVHYPTDILGGWLLGSSWTIAVASLFTIPSQPDLNRENSEKKNLPPENGPI